VSDVERASAVEAEQEFIDRIQDDNLRIKLAKRVGNGVFYSSLDLGHSFDAALDQAISVSLAWKEYFDKIVATGVIPPESAAVGGMSDILAEIEAGERNESEPGAIRKRLAELVLRQEIHIGARKIALSPQKVRQFAAEAAEGGA